MNLGPKQIEWVEALESGTYKQGRSRLFDETTGRYCCLGVACRVLGRVLVDVCLDRKYTRMGFDGDHISIIKYELMGLRDTSGSFSEPIDSYMSLMGMNDAGYSFAEIAKVIRRNPELIFTESV